MKYPFVVMAVSGCEAETTTSCHSLEAIEAARQFLLEGIREHGQGELKFYWPGNDVPAEVSKHVIAGDDTVTVDQLAAAIAACLEDRQGDPAFSASLDFVDALCNTFESLQGNDAVKNTIKFELQQKKLI